MKLLLTAIVLSFLAFDSFSFEKGVRKGIKRRPEKLKVNSKLQRKFKDNKLRSVQKCVTKDEACEGVVDGCCDDLTCYKRSEKETKTCWSCGKEGTACSTGRHCCSKKCNKNGVCSEDICRCDMDRYASLDDTTINTAVESWFEDKDSVEAKYGKIGCWNVKNVTDMSDLFDESEISMDLKCWDTSSVTKMNNMFSGTKYYNADISRWDVTKVLDMTEMFSGTYAFDQDLNNWDVSAVKSMYKMFSNTEVFDQDLCWDLNTKLQDRMFENSKGCINSKCCPSCTQDMIC